MKLKQRKFKAKRNAAALLPVVLTIAVGSWLLVYAHLLPTSFLLAQSGWVFLVLGVVGLWEFLISSYEISQTELKINSGLGNQVIGLQNIEAIARGRGFFGFHSRGTIRLKYQTLYRTRWVSITPGDFDAFVLRLLEKCPWLARPGVHT